jgi:ribosomal protein L16 Arg81 hydroxylase
MLTSINKTMADAGQNHAGGGRAAVLDQFPPFETEVYTDLILMAGDLLYIPPSWWHYIKAFEYSCNMSFWWA